MGQEVLASCTIACTDETKVQRTKSSFMVRTSLMCSELRCQRKGEKGEKPQTRLVLEEAKPADKVRQRTGSPRVWPVCDWHLPWDHVGPPPSGPIVMGRAFGCGIHVWICIILENLENLPPTVPWFQALKISIVSSGKCY